MTDTATIAGGIAGASRSEQFLVSVKEEATGLHDELLVCVGAVALRAEARGDPGESSYLTLAPTPTQQHASAGLLKRYREWFDRVRPFLDRSPNVRIEPFDESFAELSSYFAMRRVGSGVTEEVWRELFELESRQIVTAQLSLLEEAKDCFALLNPRVHRDIEDLSISFQPNGEGHYRVIAESARGRGETDLTVPFEDRDVENFVLRHCDPSRSRTRGWVPSSLQPFSDFGGRLFDSLFTGGVRDLYLKHLGAVSSSESGLRILLGMVAAPGPAGLPWEYLYDGDEFLALTGSVSVVRHLEVDRPVRPLRVEGPLRVAVTVSSPSDQAELDVAKEVEGLSTALGPLIAAGLVRLDIAQDGTIATLARMLREGELSGRPYHVWHFVGHGRYIEREGGTYLAFENSNGTSQMHSGFELGTLICSHPSVRVAVLNACEGARAAPEDSLSSVGAALVARGLPSAIAMQFAISDLAAIRFAEEFYRTLTDDGSLEAAVTDARRAIFFMPNESEWATPVVLSRAVNPVLFDRGQEETSRAGTG